MACCVPVQIGTSGKKPWTGQNGWKPNLKNDLLLGGIFLGTSTSVISLAIWMAEAGNPLPPREGAGCCVDGHFLDRASGGSQSHYFGAPLEGPLRGQSFPVIWSQPVYHGDLSPWKEQEESWRFFARGGVELVNISSHILPLVLNFYRMQDTAQYW